MKKLNRISHLLLALVLPFTLFWPNDQPFVADVLPLYVTPGMYASDFVLLVMFTTQTIALLQHSFSVRVFFRNPGNRHRILLGAVLTLIPLLAAGSIPGALSPALAAWTSLRWFLCAGLYWALAFGDFPLLPFARAFLAGLALQSLIGLGQTATGHPLGLPGELALDPSIPRAAVLYTPLGAWLRAYGLTFHPNVLGGFLFGGLALMPGLFKQPGWRWLGLLLGAGLVATFSRSAWLAALVVFPLLLVWIFKKEPSQRKPLLIALAAAVLMAVAASSFWLPPLLSRLDVNKSAAEIASLEARGELLQIALSLIRSRPLVGVGAGNFPLAQMAYLTIDPPHYVHNVAMLLASEVGVAGGIAWIFLWVYPVLQLSTRSNKSGWLYPLAAAWFGLGIIALWDSYPWALECGRLLSATLLAFLARELDNPTV
jgi:O-antigen ligase